MQGKRYGLSNIEGSTSTVLAFTLYNPSIGTTHPTHSGGTTHKETLQVVHAQFGGKSCFLRCDWLHTKFGVNYSYTQVLELRW